MQSNDTNNKPSCATCIHSDVCSYRNTFLAFQEAAADIIVGEADGMAHIAEVPYIEPIILRCKHYHKQPEGILR